MLDLTEPLAENTKTIFDWLTRKYVQRADDRQKAMGLQYTTAETHDLAHELAKWLRERPHG